MAGRTATGSRRRVDPRHVAVGEEPAPARLEAGDPDHRQLGEPFAVDTDRLDDDVDRQPIALNCAPPAGSSLRLLRHDDDRRWRRWRRAAGPRWPAAAAQRAETKAAASTPTERSDGRHRMAVAVAGDGGGTAPSSRRRHRTIRFAAVERSAQPITAARPKTNTPDTPAVAILASCAGGPSAEPVSHRRTSAGSVSPDPGPLLSSSPPPVTAVAAPDPLSVRCRRRRFQRDTHDATDEAGLEADLAGSRLQTDLDAGAVGLGAID